jgi:hypothetical protein
MSAPVTPWVRQPFIIAWLPFEVLYLDGLI